MNILKIFCQVYLSKCVFAQNATSKEEVWNDSENNVLMASCYQIKPNLNNGTIDAYDCVNGSVLMNRTLLPELANFTYLSYLHQFEAEFSRAIAPVDTELVIRQEAGLKINFEGCVNTLANECAAFLKNYGKDGSDHNARARFPCYYSPSDPSHAYQVSLNCRRLFRAYNLNYFRLLTWRRNIKLSCLDS